MKWVVLALTVLPMATPANAASFDCAGARTATEKMICSDQELSRLDDALSQEFQQTIRQSQAKDAVRKDQETWRKVRDTCADAACIRLAYEARLLALRQEPSAGQWIPDTFWMTGRQRAEAVRSLLLANSPQLRAGSYESDQEHFKFCTAFLDDFENNQRIEYIEQKLRTTEYADPALAQVRDQCPNVNWEYSAPKKCDADALASWLKGFEGDKAGAVRKANEMCDTQFGLNELALYEVNEAGHKQYVIYQSRTPGIDTARLEALLRTPTKKELWTDQSALIRRTNTVVNVFFELSGYSVINVGDDTCTEGANLGTLGFTSLESHQGIVRYKSQYIAYNLVRASKYGNELTFIVGGHYPVCYFDLKRPASTHRAE
ncbi:MAG TPA: hypothetical protein VKC56_00365 [Gallionellaceae bacterium]|nr:hypothetical protein [Gallionellaceae bacterium]